MALLEVNNLKKIYDRTSQKHLFMFCLSQALDDAAQWDRYADYGRGVAIEFNTEALHNLLYYHGMIIGEQYYTQETRDHELYKLLSSYISTGILEGFSNLDGFIDNLALCALIHKHPTFTAEKEIRIAPYFVTDNDPHIEYKTFNIIKEFYILDLQKVLETEKYAQGRYYQFNYYRTTFIPESKRFGKLLQTSWVA